MADRLAGKQSYACRIRQSSDSRDVTTAWQAVDARGDTVYQIKSPPADPDGKHAWLEFIVEVGVPA